MANNDNAGRGNAGNGPSKKGWRKSGPTRTSHGKYWKSGQGTRSISHSTKLLLAFFALVGLGAAFTYFLLRQDRAVPLLSLIATEYETPWAPNGWAMEDSEKLAQLPKGLIATTRKLEKTHGDWDRLLDEELNALTPGGPGRKLVMNRYQSAIIHLSAHGLVNDQGEPCLLFSNARPLDDKTWVPFKTVLDRILLHPKMKDVRLLLLVDASHQFPDLRMGITDNRFIERSSQLVESIPNQRLAVLFSASDGQWSWTAPELGASIFGFSLHSGLSGMADSDRNERISVIELATFVSETCQGLAQRLRGRPQSPKLVWAGSAKSDSKSLDFEIAQCNPIETLPFTESFSAAAIRSAIAKLDSTANEYQRALQDIAPSDQWSIDPVVEAAALRHLTQANRLLWAGKAYEKQFSDELNAASKWIRRKPDGDWKAVSKLHGHSLAWLQGIDSPDLRKEQNQRRDAFEAQARQWLDKLENPKEGEEPPKRPEALDRADAVVFLWKWLTEDVARWEPIRLDRAIELLPPVSGDQPIVRDETLLHSIRYLKSVEGTAGQKLFELARHFEQSVAVTDPRASLRMAQESSTANQLRRELEDWAMISETAKETDESVLQSLAGATAKCQAIDQLRKQMEEAWRFSDERSLRVPLLLELMNSPFPIAHFSDFADGMKRLVGSNEWDPDAANASTIANLLAVREDLTRCLDAYRDRLHQLAAVDSVNQGRVLGELELLLQQRPPIWTSELTRGHERMAERIEKNGSELGQTIKKIGPKSWSDLWSTNEAPLDQAPATGQADRAKTTSALLSEWISKTKNADSSSSRSLRETWTQRMASLEETTQNTKKALSQANDVQSGLEARRNLHQAMQQLRQFVHLLPDPASLEKLGLPPLATRLAIHDFGIWQANRWLDDFQRLPLLEGDSGLPFFALAAGGWLDRSQASFPEMPFDARRSRQSWNDRLEQSKRWNPWSDRFTKTNRGDRTQIEFNWSSTTQGYPEGIGFASIRTYRDEWMPLEWDSHPAGLRLASAVGGSTARSNRSMMAALPPGNHSLYAWYRGHESRASIELREQQPPFVLNWSGPPDNRSSLAVFGPPTNLKLVFVLDCSGSFSPRDHEAAETALLNVLKELPSQGTEVAVYVFGHSKDYPQFPTEPDKTNADWLKIHPDLTGRRPFNDVELLLSWQSLESAESRARMIKSLENELKLIGPFGRTPLYLSIIEAAQLLSAKNVDNANKRIIVITDGLNDVLAMSGQKVRSDGPYNVPATSQYSISQVAQAIQAANCRLDILGYAFNQNDQKPGELSSLSKNSGGNILFPKDGSELATMLREALFSQRYTVRRVRTGEVIAERKQMDEDIALDPKWFEQELEVSIHDTTVSTRLRPSAGEKIEIDFDSTSDPGKLFFRMLPRQSWNKTPFVLGNRNLLIGSPRSSSSNSRILQIGIENKDPLVHSERPSEIVVECRAREESGTYRRLGWSTSGKWVPKQLSPVLELNYSAIPPSLREPQYRIWMRRAASHESNTLPLAGLESYMKEQGLGAVTARIERGAERSLVIIQQSMEDLQKSPLLHLSLPQSTSIGSRHSFQSTEAIHILEIAEQDVDASRLRISPQVILPTDEDGPEWVASSWIKLQ